MPGFSNETPPSRAVAFDLKGVDERLSSLRICVSTPVRVRDGKRQGLTTIANPLIAYLIPRSKELFLVDHPWQADEDRTPLLEVYTKGALVRTERLVLPHSLAGGKHLSSSFFFYLVLKFIDFVSSIVLLLRENKIIDLYIGAESVNALAGLFLRKVGRVRQVIYYCHDFIPSKVSFGLGRTLVLLLDRYSLLQSDVAWNDWRETERLRNTLWKDTAGKGQIWAQTPGLPPDEKNYQRTETHSFVYLGSVVPPLGVQVVISAMPRVLSKVPDARFHIIGQAEPAFQEELKVLTERLGLTGSVIFHGYLPDDAVGRIFKQCRFGVAPYTREVLENRDIQAGDSSKTRYYAYLGLPVVFSSSIPWFAELVVALQAGVVADPDPEPFADAICRLLEDQQLYEKSLQGTFRLAAAFSSTRLYNDVFSWSFDYMQGGKPMRFIPWFAKLMESHLPRVA